MSSVGSTNDGTNDQGNMKIYHPWMKKVCHVSARLGTNNERYNELYEKKRMCIMESTSVQSFFVIAGVA